MKMCIYHLHKYMARIDSMALKFDCSLTLSHALKFKKKKA